MFGGYLHGGDMRYLTNCPPGTCGHVEFLKYSATVNRTGIIQMLMTYQGTGDSRSTLIRSAFSIAWASA